MTIKEALTIKVKSLSLSEQEVDLAIADAKLIGTADYDADVNGKEVDLVWAGLLLTTIHVTEIKEDDVSIKRSTNYKDIYSAIMRKWGLPDPYAIAKPMVTQKLIW